MRFSTNINKQGAEWLPECCLRSSPFGKERGPIPATSGLGHAVRPSISFPPKTPFGSHLSQSNGRQKAATCETLQKESTTYTSQSVCH